MDEKRKKIISEAAGQVFFHVLLFFYMAVNKFTSKIEWNEFWFFLNFATGAFLINYILLPKYYYKKKYVHFGIGVAVIITAVILSEEMLIEQLIYPDTRGKDFEHFLLNFLDAMPPIALLTGFKFAWDGVQQRRKLDQLDIAMKESELQYLKNQINPHFLFNNLNNLYSYAIENSSKTPSIILELSSVLRYMLYDCKADFVNLKDEIKHLKDFTNLNELQVEHRGKVTFSIENITDNYQIAPLILSVFVENAFKHSTASQTDNIMIEVKISISDSGILNFACRNSYQENTNNSHLSQGIGLKNVKKRLELLYPNSHHISQSADGDIYTVHLSMQLTQLEL
ncbi:sensor histidine kinase [Aureibacter tunicatorum]|uniref:Signal transduction histidine kinase internal region domain-containing protein n=1 Tax=Aureibacter tunicatorum TaxID=866807 RepID=A0AAE3XQB7_9BACT|nr:histidine kinase [Aureibacter tunicatorum]MDR6240768.1 hypothetical protein [Aureibacter tunicatorum]